MEGIKLPVQIDVENEKLLKLEMNLQEMLQLIEFECETQQDFRSHLQTARATLSTLKKAFENFASSVSEWENEKSLEEKLHELLSTHQTVLQAFQTNFQKSCMKGQKRIHDLEKSSLISQVNEKENEENLRHRKQQKKTEVASKTQEVTSDLKRIARLLDSQVKQGEESHEILETSSQQINKIGDEYKGLTGIIALSKKLLNKYNRREMTDTLLIFFGLILFFATVVFIISKRI